MFNIGDTVETTEEYKIAIEDLNRILNNNSITYFTGQVTHIQTVNVYKSTNFNIDGIIYESSNSEISETYTCITLDNDTNKQVNQKYLRKVNP